MINNKLIYGLFILFVGFAMSFGNATAQVTGEQERQGQMQNQFQGKVVNAETGEALSNVTVKIEGMDKKATTGENGQFTFKNLTPTSPQTETQEGGMGEQQNQNKITFTIDHEGYKQFSKTLSMDEIRQSQGQQQAEQDKPLKFELQPKEGSGDDY